MEWVIKENTTRYNFSDIASYLGFQTVQTQSKTDTDRLLVNSFNRDNTTHCKNNILNVTQKETVTLVIPCFNEEE
ncbi:hypothetical protein WAJ30_22375, partial [Acinetobacter baumannii]